MKINYDEMPPMAKFLYMAMTKCALTIKDMGHDLNFFKKFAEEIWVSTEMSDHETLKGNLSEQMQKDIQPHMEAYIKSKENKDG